MWLQEARNENKSTEAKRGRIVFHSGRKGLTKWLATKNNLKRVIMVGGTRDTENNKGKHVWRLQADLASSH